MSQLEEAHLREREAEKQDAVTAVEEALAHIEQQDREPDQWERVFIAEAIGAIFRGSYGLACTDVAFGMTPPDGRSAVPMLPQDLQSLQHRATSRRSARGEGRTRSALPASWPHQI